MADAPERTLEQVILALRADAIGFALALEACANRASDLDLEGLLRRASDLEAENAELRDLLQSANEMRDEADSAAGAWLAENRKLRAAIDDHIEKLRDGTYCDMGLEDIADAFRAATGKGE